MRTLTLTDGPLKGTTVIIPDGHKTFTTHVTTGHYETTGTGAEWISPTNTKTDEPETTVATTKRQAKPTRPPRPATTAPQG